MSAKYNSPRKAIPIRVEKAVLAKSRRRCTLCFGLNGDETEKRGQLAHLDGNRTNNAESNLAWMCLDHHSLFDSTTKQHKNYTISEVKEYRRLLYKVLRSAPRRSSRRARRSSPSESKQAESSTKVTNSPVASGSNITQTINSPTINVSLAGATAPSKSLQFFNYDGTSGPLNISGKQHSAQDSSLIDFWCLTTVVNYTQYPMKIWPVQLFLSGAEWPFKAIFFRLKSNPREKFGRISLVGNHKEDYELHLMFSVANSPQARSGYVLMATDAGEQPLQVEVRFP